MKTKVSCIKKYQSVRRRGGKGRQGKNEEEGACWPSQLATSRNTSKPEQRGGKGGENRRPHVSRRRVAK